MDALPVLQVDNYKMENAFAKIQLKLMMEKAQNARVNKTIIFFRLSLYMPNLLWKRFK